MLKFVILMFLVNLHIKFNFFVQNKNDFTPYYLYEKGWRCWFEIQIDYTVEWFYLPPGKRGRPDKQRSKIIRLVN